MTNRPRRPSLLQARDSNSVHPSPSSTSGSHTRSSVHLHDHRHAHSTHAHDQPGHQDVTDHHRADEQHQTSSLSASPPLVSEYILTHSHQDSSAATSSSESITTQSRQDGSTASNSSSLDAPTHSAALETSLAARTADATDATSPYVTQVVQTISIIQVVDYSGSPISTSTQYATPNTVVVDPGTGEIMSQSGPVSATDLNQSSLVPGSGSASLSTLATTTSTFSQPSSALISPSPLSGFPTLSDTSNGTVWGNMTLASTPSNSKTRPASWTQPTNHTTSSTQSSFRALTSSSDRSTSTSTDTSTDTDTETLSYSSTYGSTPTWNSPTVIPTVAGSAETSSTSSASGNDPLTTQQKEIVGGVVGSIAGVAFLALLVMLALRYKKRKGGSESLPSSTEARGLAALPAPGSHATNAMAERNAAASSFNAAFSALANKNQSRRAAEVAPDMPEGASGGERGFYRVSGRKLPSVLYTGGDGYSDPRESTMSGYSQSSEPFSRGDEPFALGSPMRPISGIPIIRSGPARTPVTEANPFADPAASPPMPKSDSPPRRPGSSGSTRGSSSRFQEGIS
ncbi:hypothetical protein IF1G_08399 [Cordyceps javanica]|uniref:Uncharacterized protein n=1 Tax=Cordyceps javanica TaxID=43265 RepID=A0A545UUG2_9HYPO|nr:hypothetical protein IF1G_08399 [Cordyceps javanica]TQW04997.1 hypothetical protein IF2G_07640 [Cordyceps javanica]